MTLHILPDLVQGSDAWHDQRRGIVTASVVGRLITASTVKVADNDYSRALTAQLVAERITGWTDPTYVNSDMWRGVEHEPFARDIYSEHYAEATECGFMVRDDWGYPIGFSPDGLVGDDGAIEIKSPRAKTHIQTVLSGEVPAQYIPQLQCGLLVSGRKWIDFISFTSGLSLWVKRVEPDERWFQAITEAVGQFELAATDMVDRYRSAVVDLPMTDRIPDLDGMVI